MIRTILSAVAVLLAAGAVGYAQEEKATVQSALTVKTQLCAGIEERMPVGAAESFGADVEKVYLWCKVTGAGDTTVIKHVWSYEGKEMAVVELPVRSSMWRTWSYKTILPEWTGKWDVKVLDAEGEILKAVSFTVGVAQTVKPDETSGSPDTIEPVDTSDTTKP